MWWLKSLILSLQVSASHIGTDSNPGCYISDLISTYGLESYREHGSRPYTHTGDLEEAPKSWLRIGSFLAIVTTWRASQWMEGFSISPPLSKSSSLTKIDKFEKESKKGRKGGKEEGKEEGGERGKEEEAGPKAKEWGSSYLGAGKDKQLLPTRVPISAR